MRVPFHFGFYGIITQPKVGYERMASLMVEHQVRFIQLRMKEVPRDEVLSVARALRPIIPSGYFFIINDDPEIAAEVGADGVHLGQDDMPYLEARGMLGEQAVVGLSTHNLEQTQMACALKPDYIGVGPVYATPTKKLPDPAIGLSGMQAMQQKATVPAVVLGGIDLSNIRDVLMSGARNVSCVRYINQTDDPGPRISELIEVIEAYRAH